MTAQAMFTFTTNLCLPRHTPILIVQIQSKQKLKRGWVRHVCGRFILPTVI